jgi:site-specific recombinase XerD
VIEWAGKPVKSLKRAFRAAAAKARLKGVTPHVLRHSVASWLAMDGVDQLSVAHMLGHKDVRTTTRIYIKLSKAHLRGKAASLDMSGVPSGSDEPEETNE